MTSPHDDADASEPLLQVVSGQPTPEELAALTAVVASLRAPSTEKTPTGDQRIWGRRQLARRRLVPGHGAWKRGAY